MDLLTFLMLLDSILLLLSLFPAILGTDSGTFLVHVTLCLKRELASLFSSGAIQLMSLDFASLKASLNLLESKQFSLRYFRSNCRKLRGR